MAKPKKTATPCQAANYVHPESDMALRPEVGAQARFKQHKPPAQYRFDSSLAPDLEWDGQSPAREEGGAQIKVISDQLSVIQSELRKVLEKVTDPKLRKLIADSLITDNLPAVQSALQKLKSLSRPLLNWAGKAERLSFDVPILPLFIHGRHTPGDQRLIAVKVIDPRGNELLVVKKLEGR